MADPLDLMNEHATLIGSVVIAYNKVQHVIFVLFVAFSGMPDCAVEAHCPSGLTYGAKYALFPGPSLFQGSRNGCTTFLLVAKYSKVLPFFLRFSSTTPRRCKVRSSAAMA
jgi:hypothetical protein